MNPQQDPDAFWNNAYKAPAKGFPRYKPKAALLSAAALVVLLVGGVGLLFWLIFMGHPSPGDGVIPASSTKAPGHSGRSGLGNSGEIKLLNSNNWMVSAGDAFMHVNGDASYMHLSFGSRGMMTSEQRGLNIARSAVKNEAFAQSLNLNADQLGRLREIHVSDMVLTDEERAALKAVWVEYQHAGAALPYGDPTRKAAERKVTEALSEISQRAYEPTRKAHAEAAEKVRAILTPEQVKQVIVLDRVPTIGGAAPLIEPK